VASRGGTTLVLPLLTRTGLLPGWRSLAQSEHWTNSRPTRSFSSLPLPRGEGPSIPGSLFTQCVSMNFARYLLLSPLRMYRKDTAGCARFQAGHGAPQPGDMRIVLMEPDDEQICSVRAKKREDAIDFSGLDHMTGDLDGMPATLGDCGG